MNRHKHELHTPLDNKSMTGKRIGSHQRRHNEVWLYARDILKLTVKVGLEKSRRTERERSPDSRSAWNRIGLKQGPFS